MGILANLVAGVLMFLALGVFGNAQDVPEDRWGELIALFVGTAALVFPAVAVVLSRRTAPLMRAVAAGEPLVGDVRRLVFGTPWFNAVVSFGGWAAAAVVFPVHALARLEVTGQEAASLSTALLLGGLTAMTVVFLLVERVMRPLVALAFAAEAPTRVRGLAIAPRLLLSWGLGSAVPLLLIALAVFSPDGDLPSLRRQSALLVVGALAAGSVIMLRASRAVSDPLRGVRDGLARVRQGDLEVAMPVDDASEIGLVQAGFNDMVAGLRERERLADLFGRHVGEDVARRALTEGVSMGGEVREASALFVDLTGSTAYAASHRPEDVVEMLNAFFEAVVRVTDAEGGWVNKFEGDAALCVFGAPAAAPDHAGRALRAARRLRDELTVVAQRYPGLDAGIGVSAGAVVAGNVGARQRFEYTVIGDPVNEAARLTDQAKSRPGRVLAGSAAVERAGGEAAHWRPGPTLTLRGRPEPTATYEPQ